MHQEYLSLWLWSKTVTLLAEQESVEQPSMGKNSDIQTPALIFMLPLGLLHSDLPPGSMSSKSLEPPY